MAVATRPKAKAKPAAKPKKATSSKVTKLKSAVSGQITEEQIAAKAYELYLQRGGQHGSDVNDWNEAKKLLGA